MNDEVEEIEAAAETHVAEAHEFAEVDDSLANGALDRLEYDDLMDVRVRITAELGSSTLRVREVLNLREGSVVTLSKLAGEMTDICANGLHLARGEIVVMNDILHVRLAEISGVNKYLARDQ